MGRHVDARHRLFRAVSVVALAAVFCVVLGGCATDPSLSAEGWAVIRQGIVPKRPVDVAVFPLSNTADSRDVWPSLSKQLTPALSRELPRYLDVQGFGPGFSALTYAVVGAQQQGDTVDVFVCPDFGSWAVRKALLQCESQGGGAYRVRLRKSGGDWKLLSVFSSPDGEEGPPVPLFPEWAERRARGVWDSEALQARTVARVSRWARTTMPSDRLTAQPPQRFPDPHKHSPQLSSERTLSDRYEALTIRRAGEMKDSMIDRRWDESWETTDGRFHLWYPVDHDGMLLEDARSGQAYFIEGPGQIPWIEDPGPPPDLPVWIGHQLVIDTCTDPLGDVSSVIHYEIDCDELKVIRAVPLGPGSFN